jgi:hypothetical protein
MIMIAKNAAWERKPKVSEWYAKGGKTNHKLRNSVHTVHV